MQEQEQKQREKQRLKEVRQFYAERGDWVPLRVDLHLDGFGYWNCRTGECVLIDDSSLVVCEWTWDEVVEYMGKQPRCGPGELPDCPHVFSSTIDYIDLGEDPY